MSFSDEPPTVPGSGRYRMQHARIWWLKGEGMWAVLRGCSLERVKAWRVISGQVTSRSTAEGCVSPTHENEVVPAAWLEVLGELWTTTE